MCAFGGCRLQSDKLIRMRVFDKLTSSIEYPSSRKWKRELSIVRPHSPRGRLVLRASFRLRFVAASTLQTELERGKRNVAVAWRRERLKSKKSGTRQVRLRESVRMQRAAKYHSRCARANGATGVNQP